ncbi:MAG: 5-formyltetrahydrofolate cyclo-ligase [Oscillospiraceae bacterium]|nr:5-formyltetrahydrofolate cyclo-ligase [Oscillospiraceae bacterium]
MTGDIREFKNQLRQKHKGLRRAMTPEEKKTQDDEIRRRVQSLYQYREAPLLLCFVSTDIEVDTKELIREALKEGKRVAVPYCVAGTRHMEFYEIRSLEDLEPRTFGVLEPVPEKCRKLSEFPRSSVCIVPGLAFDRMGYRLGYGKGYYDRFLKDYPGTKVGVVYGGCMEYRLPHGRFDVCVDLLVTEGYLRVIRRAPAGKHPQRKGKKRD